MEEEILHFFLIIEEDYDSELRNAYVEDKTIPPPFDTLFLATTMTDDNFQI